MIRKAFQNNRCGGKESWLRTRRCGSRVYGQAWIPSTHTSVAIGECEIRQLRRWQWARVPPAATPTRIYLIFPFYLFGLLLVEGHSSNPYGSVAIIGEHGGPPQRPGSLPSRSRATILHLRMHLGVHYVLSFSLTRSLLLQMSSK